MKTPTRQSKRKASCRGEVKAVVTWANPDRLHCPLTALSSVYEPHFVLPATPDGFNTMRWQVEQTYLKCEDAEITDPWEIAKLVLKSIGITQPNLTLSKP